MKQTPENLVKEECKQWLLIMGWFWRYNLQGLGAYKGMPDQMATKDGVTIEIECKSPGRKQSEAQKQYEEDLVSHGGHYVLAYGHEDIEYYIKRLAEEQS